MAAGLALSRAQPHWLAQSTAPAASAAPADPPASWPQLQLEAPATAVVPRLGASPVAAPTPEPARAGQATTDPGRQSPEDPRVEAALRALTSDAQRVGQLLLPGWLGTTAEEALPTLRELRPAGLVYVDNARAAAAATAINATLTAQADALGLPGLLLAVDHEGGTVQRITDVANLGSNRDFAAGQPSDGDACERGQTHARQLRAMGFNMNLAPVLDVNNNPANPVIGPRSYGADPALVARLGSAYVRGLQGGGIIGVGKHFPGHGNTSVDSHLQLPSLAQTEAQLEAIELVPFRRAIAPDTDLAAIMSAHIVFPAVDPSQAPATLSAPIMTGLLRERLGFQGLTMTDDMANMRAITDNFAPGQAAVRAVVAGVDLLIIAGGLPRQRESRDALLAALASGELSRERVDEAVRHVLRTKARFGVLGGAVPAETCS